MWTLFGIFFWSFTKSLYWPQSRLLVLASSNSRETSQSLLKVSYLPFFSFFFQHFGTVHVCHIWGPRTHTTIPCRNVHLLYRLFYCLSIFLCQHFRSLDYHHLSRARRSWIRGGRNWQKSGFCLLLLLLPPSDIYLIDRDRVMSVIFCIHLPNLNFFIIFWVDSEK